MSRRFAGFVLVLAVLALMSQGKADGGPPEGTSGKMVLEGQRVLTPAGLVIIRQGRGETNAEGPTFRATASRIMWNKDDECLHLEGTLEKPARLAQTLPGKEVVSTATKFVFSPESSVYWAYGLGDVIEMPRRTAQLPR
jgi:hypothetical protein